MADGKGNKKVTGSLVALSSVAVMAVYGAGYARTRAAADRFAQQATDRRARIPAPRDETPRSAEALPRVAERPIAPVAPLAPPEAAPRREARAEAEAPPSAPGAERPSPVTPTTSTVAPETSPAPIVATAPAADDESTTTSAPPPSPAQPQAAAPAQAAAAPQAPVPAPAPAPTPAPAPQQNAAFKDGTYYGWGSCRHGDIQAAVTIEAGRIVEARVERCLTRYSCNWVTPIPPRILAKQSTTYDYVSGATESSDAFQDAVAEALSQAKP